MSEVKESGEPVELNNSTNDESTEHDPQFDPIITLPEVEVSTNEENELELIKLRAKLFRFDTSDVEASQWKERGTGEVKILRHKENNSCRIVMRRDKTFKICANHFITPWMSLKPSFGSDRAWVWNAPADFADEQAKRECLAIRFANSSIANQWKEKFEEAQKIVAEHCELYRTNPTTDSTTDSGQSSESDPETPKSSKTTDTTATSKESTAEKNECQEVTDKIANIDLTVKE